VIVGETGRRVKFLANVKITSSRMLLPHVGVTMPRAPRSYTSLTHRCTRLSSRHGGCCFDPPSNAASVAMQTDIHGLASKA
jgi:hypothetical protein